MFRQRSILRRVFAWVRGGSREANHVSEPSNDHQNAFGGVPQRVEFIRGPLDGYQEHVQVGDQQCPPFVSVLISPETFFRLDGEQGHQVVGKPTSLAIYELRASRGDWRYEFCRQVSPVRSRPLNTEQGHQDQAQ